MTYSVQSRDRNFLWHPFTQMLGWEDEDFPIISRGEGNYLYDIGGKKYLDGISSLWVTTHGHNHPELNKALQMQIKQISHSTLLGLSHEPAIDLAEILIGIVPKNLQKVFFSDSGSTAVEVAIKIAYQFWQIKGFTRKKRFITFDGAYHGDTVGAVSVGGIDLFHSIFHPLLFQCTKLPYPHIYKPPKETDEKHCLEYCKQKAFETIQKKHSEIAAVIIEPMIQGASGMRLQPPGFLSFIASLCKDYNILLICDEVATGFGRTAKMFAIEHENISPDILCLAKGITGGYLPLAATLTSQDIYEAFLGKFEEFKTFFHGHTYTGNPLACAVAKKNIEIFQQPGFFDQIQAKQNLLSALLETLRQHPHVGDIRQLGLMVGIELVQDVKTKFSYAPQLRMGHKVTLECRKRGVIIRPLSDTLVLMPLLSISETELSFLVSVVQESLSATLSNC